ncbi:hypothetical protein EAI_14076 [Harpegnathos saltator]|uniref:Uncharacterized protein n=1 Tax=Harpegnathos saltator TaxID=610380 RepID=E2C7Y4_HARSA|nr:hypothetical protein EAI_14076 [Harpegnathos saltator]
MAKSEQIQIPDSRRGCCKKTDRFIYCIILNASDELLSSLKRDCALKIHTFFGDLARSIERKPHSRRTDFLVKSTEDVARPCEPRGKPSTRDSSSLVGEDALDIAARTPEKIKKHATDTMAFASHFVTLLDQIHREDLARVAKDLARFLALSRCTGDSVAECSCIRTRGFPVNGKPKAEKTALCVRKSAMSVTPGPEEAALGSLATCAIIDAEEKLDDAMAIADIATERESFSIPCARLPCARERSVSSYETAEGSEFDKTIPAFSPAEEVKSDVASLRYAEKEDTAAITAVVMSEKIDGPDELIDDSIVDRMTVEVPRMGPTIMGLAEKITVRMPSLKLRVSTRAGNELNLV